MSIFSFVRRFAVTLQGPFMRHMQQISLEQCALLVAQDTIKQPGLVVQTAGHVRIRGRV